MARVKVRASYPQRSTLRNRDLDTAKRQYERAMDSLYYSPDNSYYGSQVKAYMGDNPIASQFLNGHYEAGRYALERRRHRGEQLMRAYQNRVDRINAAPTRNNAVNATVKAIGGQG